MLFRLNKHTLFSKIFIIFFLMAFTGCNTLKKQSIIADPISKINEHETSVVNEYENGDKHIYFTNNGNKNGVELYLSTNGDIKTSYWENGNLKDNRVFINSHIEQTSIEFRIDESAIFSIRGWMDGKKEGAELRFQPNGDISFKMWAGGVKHGKTITQGGSKNCTIWDRDYEDGKEVASSHTFNNDCEIINKKMYKCSFVEKFLELIDLYKNIHEEF